MDDVTTKVSERVIEAGAVTENARPLRLLFPPGVYSLSPSRPAISDQRSELIEHPLPQSLLRPAMPAVIDRRGRAVLFGAIPPAHARLQHMDNPADHAAIIDPPWPTPFPAR